MWGGVWVHRGLVWGRVLRKNTNQTLTWDGERERERASTQGNVPHSGYCSTLRVLLHTQGIAPHSGYCSMGIGNQDFIEVTTMLHSLRMTPGKDAAYPFLRFDKPMSLHLL